jgi:uncharacterized protein YndB with AHSA1/START domain
MTVTSIDTNLDDLSVVLVAEFDASPEQVWQLWADPRRLERWWGPPTYPATFEEHDLTPGGDVAYYMTSPEGDRYRGWWRINAVDAPKSLDFTDGFANADGTRNTDLPTSEVRMELTDHGGRTRMELRSVYDTREQLEQVVAMGAAEGIREAVGQMDALLAGPKEAA